MNAGPFISKAHAASRVLGTRAERAEPCPFRLFRCPGDGYQFVIHPPAETSWIRDHGQIDWALGGINLTSITAYREYKSDQGSDTDYSTVDILYREIGRAHV